MKYGDISYLTDEFKWNVTSRRLSSRIEMYNDNKWWFNKDKLITEKEIYDNIKDKPDVYVYRDRISSQLDLDDYIYSIHDKLIYIKYDIVSTTDIKDYYLFSDEMIRLVNNKRYSKIGSMILYHSWSLDETMNGFLHMHLFLHIDASWITGNREKDQIEFTNRIKDLNKWIIRLFRTSTTEVGNSIINVPDAYDNIMNYLTYRDDIDSRNDDRVWGSYNCKVREELYNGMDVTVRRPLLYGRSKIKNDIT